MRLKEKYTTFKDYIWAAKDFIQEASAQVRLFGLGFIFYMTFGLYKLISAVVAYHNLPAVPIDQLAEMPDHTGFVMGVIGFPFFLLFLSLIVLSDCRSVIFEAERLSRVTEDNFLRELEEKLTFRKYIQELKENINLSSNINLLYSLTKLKYELGYTGIKFSLFHNWELTAVLFSLPTDLYEKVVNETSEFALVLLNSLKNDYINDIDSKYQKYFKITSEEFNSQPLSEKDKLIIKYGEPQLVWGLYQIKKEEQK